MTEPDATVQPEPEDDETVLVDTGSFFARVPKRKVDEDTGDGDPTP